MVTDGAHSPLHSVAYRAVIVTASVVTVIARMHLPTPISQGVYRMSQTAECPYVDTCGGLINDK